MAWYDVTYSCGHDGRVNLIGQHKTREWRLEREAEKLCPECWEKELQLQREEENRKAAQAAKEQELPELTGTAKQIAWAETIRQKLLTKIERYISDGFFLNEELANNANLALAIERINNQSSAAWWIDNRYVSDVEEILTMQFKLAQKEATENKNDETLQNAEIEATVRPAEPKTETVAEINMHDNAVTIRFPERRDDFRSIVKNLGYTWVDNRWKQNFSFTDGTVIDRAAEVGNALLAAGFIIRIYDIKTRELAINGQFEKKYTRWIVERVDGEYAGWFAIKWEGKNENLYNAARNLPRSKWSKPHVVVPPEMFEDVLDFAELYDFKLSKGAQKLVNAARNAKESALTVHVEQPKSTEKPVRAGIPKLEIPQEVTIDAELRDDN